MTLCHICLKPIEPGQPATVHGEARVHLKYKPTG